MAHATTLPQARPMGVGVVGLALAAVGAAVMVGTVGLASRCPPDVIVLRVCLVLGITPLFAIAIGSRRPSRGAGLAAVSAAIGAAVVVTHVGGPTGSGIATLFALDGGLALALAALACASIARVAQGADRAWGLPGAAAAGALVALEPRSWPLLIVAGALYALRLRRGARWVRLAPLALAAGAAGGRVAIAITARGEVATASWRAFAEPAFALVVVLAAVGALAFLRTRSARWVAASLGALAFGACLAGGLTAAAWLAFGLGTARGLAVLAQTSDREPSTGGGYAVLAVFAVMCLAPHLL